MSKSTMRLLAYIALVIGVIGIVAGSAAHITPVLVAGAAFVVVAFGLLVLRRAEH